MIYSDFSFKKSKTNTSCLYQIHDNVCKFNSFYPMLQKFKLWNLQCIIRNFNFANRFWNFFFNKIISFGIGVGFSLPSERLSSPLGSWTILPKPASNMKPQLEMKIITDLLFFMKKSKVCRLIACRVAATSYGMCLPTNL